MARHMELHQLSHFTVGTKGQPGQRVFYIQGAQGDNLVTLILEKQQARMLGSGYQSLLEEMQKSASTSARALINDTIHMDLRLRQPLEPLFRVGNIGIGYNEEADRVATMAYELVDEDEEPNVVSFWATIEQIKALVPHIQDVVSAGRPICGNCGQPIDASGHFCPRRNGHKT